MGGGKGEQDLDQGAMCMGWWGEFFTGQELKVCARGGGILGAH